MEQDFLWGKSDTLSHTWTAPSSLEEMIFLTEFWIELQFSSSSNHIALIPDLPQSVSAPKLQWQKKGNCVCPLLKPAWKHISQRHIHVWIRKDVNLRKIGYKFYHPVQFSHSHIPTVEFDLKSNCKFRRNGAEGC